MLLKRDVAGLRHEIAGWRAAGQGIALVPTMGALHEGHLSLVRLARQRARRVVVSIFVNPAQFGPNEDFARYPRSEDADAAALRAAGADLLYAPGTGEIYPDGFATTVSVAGLDRRWEGEIRPGHFAGVATIVAKLLNQASPDYALFGEKDYQQLQVIRRMARDLNLPVEIVGCPTMRDASGLALSSRNAYLSAAQLEIARSLNRVMKRIAGNPEAATANLEGKKQELLAAGFDAVDYLVLCDPETLEPMTDGRTPARLLAAVRLGGVRLLDNMQTG